MRSQKHPKIVTKDRNENENGFLVPIYNVHDGFVWGPVQQVYLTTINPGMQKGPHLHMKRTGYFTCIMGNVMIVTKLGEDAYHIDYSGEDFDYATIEIPPGIPTLIINSFDRPAMVINTTYPAWTPEDQDDFPVVGWDWSAKNNVA